jgi:ABC-type dipeptide/oligopeptide/nickel transport system permease subunit
MIEAEMSNNLGPASPGPDAAPSRAAPPSLGSEQDPRTPDFALRKHRSLWGDAWRRLVSGNTARLGMVIIGLLVLGTVLTHLFWEYDPRTDLDYALKLKPPNLRPTEEIESIHPFGTDVLGRDIFRRVAHGGWNSLRVGIVAVSISLSIGVLLGLLAGYYEGMPLGQAGRSVIGGGIGLLFGALIAWISQQSYALLLFFALGVVAAWLDQLWAGKPARLILFGSVGLLFGALPGLTVNPLAGLVCGLLGLLAGLIVGLPFGGSWLSSGIMRVMDIILAFPGILLAIAIAAMLGPGLEKGMIAIGVVGIPVYARLMRSTVLSVVQQEYVTASLSVGVGQQRILFRHIFPNCLSPIIVQATLGLGAAILSAAALGFLGLGAIPPEPEWGAMLGDSYKYLASGSWWAVLFPGIMIMLAVLGFNLFGDGLRDALDPRLRV